MWSSHGTVTIRSSRSIVARTSGGTGSPSSNWPTSSSHTSGRCRSVDVKTLRQVGDALVAGEAPDEPDDRRVGRQPEPLTGLGPGRQHVVGEPGHVDAVARTAADHLAATGPIRPSCSPISSRLRLLNTTWFAE